ncbi:AraC family transcriptional regulator ligand-binding domain-containing protein [Nocardia sp. 2]|uniref:AraC family transcriptional regulator ligand-binding domain-containing protein n=1 Tax=Nocardia acididurans TaxID=2802282 RepID=A0ABS1MCG0_9NOCA|nr:AraC family transcriptional regulator [Nocardia acididurans]MBL1078333.1 AraC family transcriptional regulator ligand-binding domain-containing protein [Nocardia acididurans]
MSADSWCVRSIHSAATLVDFAVSRSVTRAAALADTGLDDRDLEDPDIEIDLAQEFRIIANILDAVGDEPGTGLLVGFSVRLPMLGTLGIAMSSCSTVREMSELWVRYVDLSFAYNRFTLTDAGSRVLVTLDPEPVPAPLRRFALERDLAALRIIQRDLLSWDVPVRRLELSLPYAPVYEAVGVLLGVDDIVFDRPVDTLVIDAAELERPMPQANSMLRKQYEKMCADIVERRRARAGLSGQVRALLLRYGGAADQPTIAADLHTSVRTLRRRLAEEGTTFRELACETTGILAEELLATGLTVDTVASRLGYTSVSAFAAAFRDWKGQTPGRFARENHARWG